MRNLRLLFMSVTVLLLGTAAVSAQDMKTNAKAGAPMTQQNAPTEQNAPAEKMAPASKSDQHRATEKGESDSKQQKSQKMDKGAATGAANKGQPMRPTRQTRSQTTHGGRSELLGGISQPGR